MNAAEVHAKVESSLAADQVEHVLRGRFVSKRIFPTTKELVVPDHVSAQVNRAAGVYPMLFVNDDDPTNVFYDEQMHMFGAAWGPDKVTGHYLDLGLRGMSVLEMLSA